MAMEIKQKRTIGLKEDIIFYVLLAAWPVIQFCIFYIGVNFNSFLLSFQEITLDPSKGGYVKAFSLNTFPLVWELVSSKFMIKAAGLSLLSYVISTGVSLPLSLFFSYYIAKKFKFAGFFRVVLFLPSILSSVAMVTFYQNFVDMVIPKIIEDLTGRENVLSLFNQGKSKAYLAVMFYNVWVGFGTGVLMYSNAMSAISPEIYDAASIDGAEGINEFRFISYPLIFSTFSVFFITSVAHIFTNQQNLYTFYAEKAPFNTFGYYLFSEVKKAGDNPQAYPKLACFGLIMSAVCIPLTFTVRWLLEKFGPSED